MGIKETAFKQWLDSVGYTTQHGAKHHYCKEIAGIVAADWNKQFKQQTSHYRLLAKHAVFVGVFPVGKGGRLVNVWKAKSCTRDIAGFIGDVDKPRVNAPTHLKGRIPALGTSSGSGT